MIIDKTKLPTYNKKNFDHYREDYTLVYHYQQSLHNLEQLYVMIQFIEKEN